MKRLLLLCTLGLATLGAAGQVASADINVFVGYADNLRPSPFFPSPWDGDPGVIFLGQHGGSFDGGAIRLQNTGPSDVVLGPGAHVDGFNNGANFQLWDGLIGTGVTIHPGENLVLTQTSGENFDTSDQTSGSPSSPDTNHPVIHLTLNNQALDFVDSAQVLNTGGFDLAAVNNSNESLQWRPIGTTGIENPGGNPNPGGVPEPGSMALLGSGLLCLGGFAIRRRASRK
ncbi:MAG TPA: PEP-CTERM sorting domain-containing protein [Chthonomonadaceae bacterium]|nr:PEP-CTERM sorting domain-containing protein [Chthonomonadaceae bacterium]